MALLLNSGMVSSLHIPAAQECIRRYCEIVLKLRLIEDAACRWSHTSKGSDTTWIILQWPIPVITSHRHYSQNAKTMTLRSCSIFLKMLSEACHCKLLCLMVLLNSWGQLANLQWLNGHHRLVVLLWQQPAVMVVLLWRQPGAAGRVIGRHQRPQIDTVQYFS